MDYSETVAACDLKFDIFYGRLKLRLLHEENVTMMDSVEIIASCDLKFGLYSLLNE